MKKTIRIDDIKEVQVCDMLFVKGCSDGFRVAGVLANSLLFPVAVDNPFADSTSYVSSDRFDHAERTVEEPEWPEDPKDDEVHWYKDSDGGIIGYEKEYWYMTPFTDDGMSREDAMKWYKDSLPLTEMKLVPKEEES